MDIKQKHIEGLDYALAISPRIPMKIITKDQILHNRNKGLPRFDSNRTVHCANRNRIRTACTVQVPTGNWNT